MSSQDPYGQRSAKASEKSAQPKITLRKQPCTVCAWPHWRPDGKARCVACELRRLKPVEAHR